MSVVAAHDLEGIVAKRKRDTYRRGVPWWKIKNRGYSQAEDEAGCSTAIGGIVRREFAPPSRAQLCARR
jgi:hypothetical protein